MRRRSFLGSLVAGFAIGLADPLGALGAAARREGPSDWFRVVATNQHDQEAALVAEKFLKHYWKEELRDWAITGRSRFMAIVPPKVADDLRRQGLWRDDQFLESRHVR